MASTILTNQIQASGLKLMSPCQDLEVDLVRRVQLGDQIAFRSLVERYQSSVYSALCDILRNRKDADEVAVRVFAKAYHTIRSFDLQGPLHSWIHGIMVRECVGFLRSGCQATAGTRVN